MSPTPLRHAAALFLAACWTLNVLPQNRDTKPPTVVWVNPKLPPGPGLTHHVLNSEVMKREVGYVVWTPPEFERDGSTRYPVIYFLHGIGGNESADAAGFSGHVAKAIADGTMPPVLCVFPNGGRSGYRGEVEEMIVTELIPTIDHDFPTRATREARVVAGFSMGGAGAVRLALLHPNLFSAAGSWGGGMGRNATELLEAADKAAPTLKPHFRFLLVNGEKDRPNAYDALVEKLSALGIHCQRTVLPDTPHNLGLYYQRSGEEMMRFLGEALEAPGSE